MLEKYLSQRALVQNVLTIDDLLQKTAERKRLNIMMGQTFDEGQPVDMMKYALFMMDLGDILAQKGIEVSSNWLIADHFITDINKEGEAAQIREQVKKRVAYLQRINEVYNGNIGVILSSELSQREGYKRNLAVLMREAERNSTFREAVLRAVPKERRDNPSSLQYPFEELATIQTIDADIKVGPPYEIFYDEPARQFAPMIGFNRYVAIHLTRGFPFGSPNISRDVQAEIEQFGVLPYKKNSKGLGDYRIDPLNDDPQKVRKLIYQTTDVRSLVDLMVISEMAQQRLQNEGGKITFFAEKGLDMVRELSTLSFEYGDEPRGRPYMESANLIDSLLPAYFGSIHNPLYK